MNRASLATQEIKLGRVARVLVKLGNEHFGQKTTKLVASEEERERKREIEGRSKRTNRNNGVIARDLQSLN